MIFDSTVPVGGAWEAADLLPPAAFRLYRATASSQFVLGPHDQRLPVEVGAS